MAVFVIRALLKSDTFPYSAVQAFDDVPPSHPYFRYIQKMKELGITSGCSATQYCPDGPVTRAQMAAFLIRAKLGTAATATVPPRLPYFTDVSPEHPQYPYIQRMRQWGITAGCSDLQYCPDAATTRGQMAVFLIRTFYPTFP